MQAVRLKINFSRHFRLLLPHYIKLVTVSLNNLEKFREISKEIKLRNNFKKFAEFAGVIFRNFCVMEISLP
jgi:hypothetical protein